MIKELLSKVAAKQDLSYDEAKSAIAEIMGGNCSPVLISAFLTALAMKGETDDEIAGCADGMRGKALKMDLPFETLDIVGTGGDKSLSFNISTTAAFVLAAAGVKIAKHGNRAASSGSGAADCLEALGVNINADIDVMKKSIEQDNIGFLFAQKYHSAMRFVGPVRKEIGIRTVFNILGPLTNPAAAKMMVLGVFSEEYVEKVAKALVKLGVENALVVYGRDTLDEISACGETSVAEVRGENIKYYTITPICSAARLPKMPKSQRMCFPAAARMRKKRRCSLMRAQAFLRRKKAKSPLMRALKRPRRQSPPARQLRLLMNLLG